MARTSAAVSTFVRRIRTQWPHALRLIPILCVPFIVLWQASLYLDSLLSYQRRITATREATRRASDLFDEALSDYAADLKVISSGGDIRSLAAGDMSAKDAVSRAFVVFVSARRELAQVRYIDRNGMEVVRVDEAPGNKVSVIPQNNLQYKGDRYFFRDSINLPPNTLYISPIDLDYDHGQIVVPHKPTLRLATVMMGKDGHAGGVIVINVDVQGLIEDIQAERPVNSSTVQLLNSEGYWLGGAPESDLWGFMFGRDTTMAKQSPEAWRNIASKDHGSFTSGGLHYNYQTAHPDLSVFSGPDDGTLNVVTSSWKLVGIVPGVQWTDIWQREQALPAYIGIIAVALIAFGWSSETVRRQNAEELKRRSDIELIQKERMASLGSLVAGVAHELGTPIGNAVTIASTLADKASSFRAEVESGQLRRSVLTAFLNDLNDGMDIMVRGLGRASKLIRHFKQIAVDQTSEHRRVFKLIDLMRDTIATLETEFKQNVTLTSDITSTADLDTFAGLLEQVLINLITNARIHGFDEGQTGQVIVTAKDLPSKEVEILIRDNGKGISLDILDRIFEPFFTTRLGLGGSGLGLSIVFNIVTGPLGGTIRAESEVGKGTAMILRIPFSPPTATSTAIEGTYHAEQVS